MPQETFLKLPQEKKEKIIRAAKEEFSRVPIEEVSIKKIAENAAIARGSFYQYFEDKEDLLLYILDSQIQTMKEILEKSLSKTNGDLFGLYIDIYDSMNFELDKETDMKLFKKILENIKIGGDYLFSERVLKNKEEFIDLFYNNIDRKNLKVKDKKELEMVSKMVFTITKKAMVERFKFKSKEEARKEFIKQIEFLKYGIMKGKEEIC